MTPFERRLAKLEAAKPADPLGGITFIVVATPETITYRRPGCPGYARVIDRPSGYLVCDFEEPGCLPEELPALLEQWRAEYRA